jgi:hypothetical protein
MVSQVEALERTIGVLSLGQEHDALVAYCLGLATALDEHPDRASLWREYRPALELLGRVGEGADDDGEGSLLQLVRTAVGYEADAGPGDVGAGGGRRGRKPGPAADAVAEAGC